MAIDPSDATPAARELAEARPVRKLRLEPFDDVFDDPEFARRLVETRDDTTADNVRERADDLFDAEETRYSRDADSEHVAVDWLGDTGWLGSPDAAEIFAKAFRTAIRIADARGVPITALWVPLTAEGKGSVSVAVAPRAVVVVIVSYPAGNVKVADMDLARIWDPHDPRVLHFSSETLHDDAFSIDRAVEYFRAGLPTQQEPGSLYG